PSDVPGSQRSPSPAPLLVGNGEIPARPTSRTSQAQYACLSVERVDGARRKVEGLPRGPPRRMGCQAALVLDDRCPPARPGLGGGAAAEAAPGRPEHHRDEGADDADDERSE